MTNSDKRWILGAASVVGAAILISTAHYGRNESGLPAFSDWLNVAFHHAIGEQTNEEKAQAAWAADAQERLNADRARLEKDMANPPRFNPESQAAATDPWKVIRVRPAGIGAKKSNGDPTGQWTYSDGNTAQ